MSYLTMKQINNILIADEGKIIRCKCHHVIMGTEVYLREKMKDDVLVPDAIDNYEEIDEPENNNYE